MTVQIQPPVDMANGLSRAEVDARVTAGAVNTLPEGPSRTIEDIVRANVFTRFNVLVTVLLVVILIVAPPQDALFGLVMVVNAAIGIVQEIRAKNQLDQLALVSAPQAKVIREGRTWRVDVSDVVLDDLIEAAAGDQIVVDGVVVETNRLELDESLLTGESDPVAKRAGDEVLSGSFVVAGAGVYRAVRVGSEAYAVQLGQEAKRFTLVKSELRDGIDWILAAISWAIVPAAAILIWSQLEAAASVKGAFANAVAGTIGMVPQGLVLVTSIAFAVGVVRLAQRRVLVQELPAIEGLARVDVVCFDKTGTLTEGKLVHAQTLRLSDIDPAPVIGALAAADPAPNATTKALQAAYAAPDDWTLTEFVPFSSARKWSAYEFEGRGAWVIGAPDVIPFGRRDIEVRIDEQTTSGRRVLMLASLDELPSGDRLTKACEPIALVILGDTVREDAPATLEFFLQQGVAAKVISGDDPETVGAIARRAGVVDAHGVVDARDLPEDGLALVEAVKVGTVFGRVSPRQKRSMVRALQAEGHTVAMTGDGVNDVLALKDADIGIAMGSGSAATRAVAQLVLLDSDFATLPHVVAEGRRVIANIERVANLYLTKTVYAFALVIAIGVAGFAFPFLPRHLTLVGSLTIGIPSLFLALEPSHKRAQPGFIPRVLRFAVPTGVLAAVATFVAFGLAEIEAERLQESRTVATIVLASVGLFVLAVVMRPLQPRNLALLWGMVVLFAIVLLNGSAKTFFNLDMPRAVVVFAGIGLVGLTGGLMYLALWVSGWLRGMPEVVRVTQERVREGGFSLARLRALRRPPAVLEMLTGDMDGPAGGAEAPADPQLTLPFDES